MPELHITLVFKIVHRRSADRTPHCFALSIVNPPLTA
jgi:hypothetical protein